MWSNRAIRRLRRREDGSRVRRGLRHDPWDDPDALVVTAPMEEILAAVEAVDLEQGWDATAPALVPLLPRLRPLPPMDEPLVRVEPPGLAIRYGVDIGPAFWYVAAQQLGAWGVTADEVAARALANVRARVASRRQFALIREPIGDVETLAFQSREGWASTLLLMPDELMRVFGEEPGLVLAPMRDVILRLPIDVDRAFALWLLDEFRDVDMNALDVPPLAFANGTLSVDAGYTDGNAKRRH